MTESLDQYVEGAAPESLDAYLEGVTPPPPQEPSALSTFLRPFANVAEGLVNLPGAAYRAVKSDVGLIRKMAAEPSTIPEVAKATARGWGQALTELAPTAATMAMGAMAAGPAGAVILPAVEKYWRSRVEGQTIPQAYEAGATIGVGGALAAQAPTVAQLMKKLPGRYLSLPAERHAAGAAMMEEIPGRFGVDDALVTQKYNTARQLGAQETVGTAPLTQLKGAASRMNAEIQANPIPSLRDSSLAKQVASLGREIGDLGEGVTAKQVDSIIKGINQRIASTEGAERGAWKQMLGATHEDMKAAAATTGDPAFQAYADAIGTARLNFLKGDLEEVIKTAGVRMQRTGQSLVTSPGAIVQWMRRNPDWVAAVEKAEPGLMNSIRQDIQEIVPVTDVVGRSIPGQRFGSGRLVLGGAIGHLLSRVLNLPPGTAESLGAIFGGLSPGMGMKISPEYIRSSFRPITTGASTGGALVGGGLGAVAPNLDERLRRTQTE